VFKCLSRLINNIFMDRHTVVKLTLKTQLAPRTVFRILRSEWSLSWKVLVPPITVTEKLETLIQSWDHLSSRLTKLRYSCELEFWKRVQFITYIHCKYQIERMF